MKTAATVNLWFLAFMIYIVLPLCGCMILWLILPYTGAIPLIIAIITSGLYMTWGRNRPKKKEEWIQSILKARHMHLTLFPILILYTALVILNMGGPVELHPFHIDKTAAFITPSPNSGGATLTIQFGDRRHLTNLDGYIPPTAPDSIHPKYFVHGVQIIPIGIAATSRVQPNLLDRIVDDRTIVIRIIGDNGESVTSTIPACIYRQIANIAYIDRKKPHDASQDIHDTPPEQGMHPIP